LCCVGVPPAQSELVASAAATAGHPRGPEAGHARRRARADRAALAGVLPGQGIVACRGEGPEGSGARRRSHRCLGCTTHGVIARGRRMPAAVTPRRFLPVIRRGTTRTVLVLGPVALKLALGERGRRCNRFEAGLYKRVNPSRRAMLCPVALVHTHRMGADCPRGQPTHRAGARSPDENGWLSGLGLSSAE
jgi:hypothetical protein